MFHRKGVRRTRSYQRPRDLVKQFKFDSDDEQQQQGDDKDEWRITNSSHSDQRLAGAQKHKAKVSPLHSLHSQPQKQELWTRDDDYIMNNARRIRAQQSAAALVDVLALPGRMGKISRSKEEEDDPLYQSLLERRLQPRDTNNDYDDDQSVISSSSSENSEDENLASNNPQDMMYSLSSNVLFLVGASIQTGMAIWDVTNAFYDENYGPDDDQPDEVMDDGHLNDDPTTDNKSSRMLYNVLNSAGPFVFIGNAMVDVLWALTLPPAADGRGQHRSAWAAFRNLPLWDMMIRRQHDVQVEEEIMEKFLDFATGVTFGIGAVLEFYSTFFDDGDDDDSDITVISSPVVHNNQQHLAAKRYYKVNMIAMHTYLISGLLVVHKDRSLLCYPGGSLARRLIACGMILFLMGSILDCVISYLFNPALVASSHNAIITDVTLALCNLCSTLLWNANAILYVTADILVFPICQTKLCRPVRSFWVWLKQHCMRRTDQVISSLELPVSLMIPYILEAAVNRHQQRWCCV